MEGKNTMDAWNPITRGKPTVEGSHRQYDGLLVVRIELSDVPHPEWARIFLGPVSVPISMSMHPPQLAGHTIEIHPSDNEIEMYVSNVDARIKGANEYFEVHVLPRLREERQRQEAAQKAATDRIAAAREKASKL
jgi:hypothetical protein